MSRLALLEELRNYPQEWALTPLDDKKRPYRKDWQKEKALSRWFLENEVRSGRAKGIGVRAGVVSGGLLIVDFDGFSAVEKYLELSGSKELPKTIGWTSGRPGHFHLAFKVPKEQWDSLASRSIATAWDENGKVTERLEVLWNGRQSVLPGSKHPITEGYKWKENHSQDDTDISSPLPWMEEIIKAEPKEKTFSKESQHFSNNPTDNPWDIRNFAHYLEGYQPDGRRGWDTCKCPAHNGQSDDSLHIEQSTGAYKCHADCDPKEIYHAALEIAKSRGYQLPEKRMGHSFSGLFGWLPRLKQRIEKSCKIPWGVGRKAEVEVEPTPAKTLPAIEYQDGERLDIWSESSKRGVKNILDTSGTGTGKSFDAGSATPELFGVRQLIYVSAEHRNPTTPTLQEWPDLEARHEGLVRDESDKLRRAKSGEVYVVPPNCGRNGTISALRSKNIPGADTSEKVCLGCKFLETCRGGAGQYNYLSKRAEKLSQPQLRAHPLSLASPDEFNYSEVVLIWEEATESVKNYRPIKVRITDLERTIADLAVKSPTEFDTLRPALTSLHSFLSGEQKQPNKFGWNNAQLLELLPKLENTTDVNAITKALAPDLEFLNSTSQYGVDSSELPRQVRKKFVESDSKTAEEVQRKLALNWLPDFLTVLLGNSIGGSLKIQYGVLTINLPDQRLATIAQAAKANIFLDATASDKDLSRTLGVDPSEILTVQQAMPNTGNLEIVQVATMGRLGISSRRKNKESEDTPLQKRLDALTSQVQQKTLGKVATIDFKKHTQQGDGKFKWWTDSRGVNDLEDCDALILIGVPCRNIADLEAEFTALYRRSPNPGTELVKYPIQAIGQPSTDLLPYFEMKVSADKEFRDFVRRRILADIHQAIGRLRAHRRPGKQLKVYIIADYPLDIPVRLVKASRITPEAATKTERIEMAIRGAVQYLKATGQKITQQAIAAATKLLDPDGKGYSQQYISRFKVLLQTLLSDSNNVCSKNEEPPPDPDEVQWAGEKYLPMLAEAPLAELLEGVLVVFESYGHKVWRQIWEAVPAAAQIKIIQALVLTLPAGEFRALAALTQ